MKLPTEWLLRFSQRLPLGATLRRFCAGKTLDDVYSDDYDSDFIRVEASMAVGT